MSRPRRAIVAATVMDMYTFAPDEFWVTLVYRNLQREVVLIKFQRRTFK